MSFAECIVEPKNMERQDTLIMYPLPVLATIQNTGSRLQKMADETGTLIVASDLYLQNKKTIFDMTARQANQPTGDTYVSMSQRRAEFYMNIADRLGAHVRIGMGDSLGVSAIQGMQLHGEQPTFDALLLRDGWNLDEETTTFRGIVRYARYQVRDTLHQRRDKVQFDIPATEYEQLPKEKRETSIIDTLKNVSDIMRGPHNRNNALMLAKLSGVAMNIVTLSNGLSTSDAARLRQFNTDLREARASRHPYGIAQKLLAEYYSGWHSDLLDPKRGAADLEQTFSLHEQ